MVGKIIVDGNVDVEPEIMSGVCKGFGSPNRQPVVGLPANYVLWDWCSQLMPKVRHKAPYIEFGIEGVLKMLSRH